MSSPNVVETIRSALLQHLPERTDAPITELRRGGSAFAVGSDLIVRVGRTPGQAGVLHAVADRSTLPVPAPLFVDAENDVLAYRPLDGVPLPNTEITAFGARLGAFLSRLHGTYVGTVDRVVPAGDPALDDPAARLAAAHERRSRLHPDLSVAARALVDRQLPDVAPARGDRRAVCHLDLSAAHERRSRLHPDLSVAARALVDRQLPDVAPARGDRRAVCHLDLSAAHILMRPATGEISGVLGWGGAAVADPARDFAVILTDLGTSMYDALAAGYRGPPDAGMHDRAAFFARCLLLERIERGLITHDRVAAQDALRRLQKLG